jgi:hypothetical protein
LVPRLIKALVVTVLLATTATGVHAEPSSDVFSAGGYFRIMTRPDFQGGDGKLGHWNLHGRLLNEGPYAMLEMQLALLPQDADSNRVWTSVHARIEGGSVQNADVLGGTLDNFRLSQLYARAGNVLFEDVTWQLGTLFYYFGDLGLYDMRPAAIFFETVGLSATYNTDDVEFQVGVGDSGYFVRGTDYSTILTIGSSLRLRLSKRFELGVAGQLFYEPGVTGNRFAPHKTPSVDYEDFVRGEVAERFLEDNPGREDFFPKPEETSDISYKGVFYLGFSAGPIRWNNLFVTYERRFAENFRTEQLTVNNTPREFTIYSHDLTDERTVLTIGNEMQLALVPSKLDLVWGILYGAHTDGDNDSVSPSDHDRSYVSTVVRLQYYATRELHFLFETSLARETSDNGNLYRKFGDSVFQSTDGLSDTRGLEFGDSKTRDTWQLKVGPTLSPTGWGVYARPSFRLLYGLQYSSQINAFGNNFVESLDQFNDFGSANQRWHHLVALEVETWF